MESRFDELQLFTITSLPLFPVARKGLRSPARDLVEDVEDAGCL